MVPTKGPIDQTFEDVERFVYALVRGTMRQYPFLDPHAVLSAAHMGFMEAFHKYEAELGNEFNTYVGYLVKKRIQSVLIRTAKANAKAEEFDVLEIADVETSDDVFCVQEWLNTLPRDARLAARLALDRPIDIVLVTTQMKSDKPEAVRFAIREFLAERGWEADRIREAFQTVKENL